MVLDGFEGDFAILQATDSGLVFRIPRSLVPNGAREGDSLTISVTIDIETTEKSKRSSEELLKDFFDE